MHLKYSRDHENVIKPERANPSDAGLDVFYCPDVEAAVVLMPAASAILTTGLKFEIPPGYMLEAKNRSSVAAKQQLLVGACVIDSGYAGTVFINLHNVGDKPRTINPGDKIAQLVLIPIATPVAEEITEEELLENNKNISDRGEGALGSTDKK